jgi:hypothetical protein
MFAIEHVLFLKEFSGINTKFIFQCFLTKLFLKMSKK